MVNKKRLIRLTRKLIGIDSQNPPGDELCIAQFVKEYLMDIGIKAGIYEFKRRRANVVAKLKGRNRQRSLLITPHLDTVPCGRNWRFNPFSGAIDKGRIYGLGATDCKGNLAVSMEAMNSLLEDKIILDYNLIFAATADEETGSHLGLIPLLEKGIIKPDVAVVLDADNFNLIITQKGLLHLKVKIPGKRAHGAYPWRGINAIDIAVNMLKDLKGLKIPYPKNKYLRPPTLNIGTIKGGDKVNVVADYCEFELDLRFLPRMKEKKILREIKNVLKKHSRRFKIEIKGFQKPCAIERNHPLVNYLIKAMKKIKIIPRIKGSEGATTITFFQNKKIPAVATGFGASGCAHIADEHAEVSNLYKGALVLEEFLKTYHFNNLKEH